MRKEMAKLGRDEDMVEFDCFLLCMTCGHLVEPLHGDPMRSEGRNTRRACTICGAPGLIDLRHTPTVLSLNDLEVHDTAPRRWQRARDVLGFLTVVTIYVALAGFVIVGQLGDDLGLLAAGFILVPLTLLSLPLIIPLASAITRGPRERRVFPRRWRLPRSVLTTVARPRELVRGRARELETGSTLRAPLSGRPCLAYEVAVRDDASAAKSLGSWRLIEQDNVGFCVGDVEVERGEALLKLPRELERGDTLASADERTRHFMRMRGLLETDTLYVYETVLLPGAECAVGRSMDAGPVQVLAA